MVAILVVSGLVLIGVLALGAWTLRFAVYGAYGFPQRALEAQATAAIPAQRRTA
ncbi:MAG: hypothetical protein HXY30_01535 [Pseudorhodoplanes sp.]|nr:hypothetical protein [Pseudorhodoplanes sp.]